MLRENLAVRLVLQALLAAPRPRRRAFPPSELARFSLADLLAPTCVTKMIQATHINLYGTAADSIVDGPGLRFSVFTQGCSHGCPGCHNPASQPFEGGTLTPISSIVEEVRANGLIQGVTLSGGEPFEQAQACAELAAQLKELGYNVWTYTGFLYEDLLRSPDETVARLLEHTDVLVDGPFVASRKSLGLLYRGSSNQRLIDLAATRKAGRVVEWSSGETFPVKPASW